MKNKLYTTNESIQINNFNLNTGLKNDADENYNLKHLNKEIDKIDFSFVDNKQKNKWGFKIGEKISRLFSLKS